MAPGVTLVVMFLPTARWTSPQDGQAARAPLVESAVACLTTAPHHRAWGILGLRPLLRRAQPGHLGSLRWPEQPASGRPKLRIFLLQPPGARFVTYARVGARPARVGLRAPPPAAKGMSGARRPIGDAGAFRGGSRRRRGAGGGAHGADVGRAAHLLRALFSLDLAVDQEGEQLFVEFEDVARALTEASAFTDDRAPPPPHARPPTSAGSGPLSAVARRASLARWPPRGGRAEKRGRVFWGGASRGVHSARTLEPPGRPVPLRVLRDVRGRADGTSSTRRTSGCCAWSDTSCMRSRCSTSRAPSSSRFAALRTRMTRTSRPLPPPSPPPMTCAPRPSGSGCAARRGDRRLLRRIVAFVHHLPHRAVLRLRGGRHPRGARWCASTAGWRARSSCCCSAWPGGASCTSSRLTADEEEAKAALSRCSRRTSTAPAHLALGNLRRNSRRGSPQAGVDPSCLGIALHQHHAIFRSYFATVSTVLFKTVNHSHETCELCSLHVHSPRIVRLACHATGYTGYAAIQPYTPYITVIQPSNSLPQGSEAFQVVGPVLAASSTGKCLSFPVRSARRAVRVYPRHRCRPPPHACLV